MHMQVVSACEPWSISTQSATHELCMCCCVCTACEYALNPCFSSYGMMTEPGVLCAMLESTVLQVMLLRMEARQTVKAVAS
jgi:hypothetical protein